MYVLSSLSFSTSLICLLLKIVSGVLDVSSATPVRSLTSFSVLRKETRYLHFLHDSTPVLDKWYFSGFFC